MEVQVGEDHKTITRRSVLGAAGAGLGLAGLNAAIARDSNSPVFTHGVASGDPQQARIILWTRVINPADKSHMISGTWQISTDEDFANIANQGSFKTGPRSDFTVKVDADGLQPNSSYYYRFLVGDVSSPTGKTKTLPIGATPFSLAVVSCSNYSHGHFHVYKEIAKRDYQAVLHLGDYIYEYAEGKYDNPRVLEQGRTTSPKTETLSLEDYRRRYAHYRTDPDLQAVHAAHPFICVWDDHEVANDTWKDGAENHTEDEGDFRKRQKSAMRAYYEWLPIRETEATAEGKIYRTFELGDFADLIMLDTRHIGRDRGLVYQSDLPMRTIPFDFSNPEAPIALLSREALEQVPAAAVKQITVPFKLGGETPVPMTDWATIKTLDPKNLPQGYTYLPDVERFKTEILGAEERSILGAEQEAWLTAELAASRAKGKPWQIIGQQLLSGKLGIPAVKDSDIDYEKSKYFTQPQMAFFRMLGQMGLPLNLDAWDGYPNCRDRVFASAKQNANNLVMLAGDTHNAWAFDLADSKGEKVGVELGTPGVSSPGLENYLPVDPEILRNALLAASPELKFANTRSRGWMSLQVSSASIDASWHFVSTVIEPDYEVHAEHKASVKAGQRQIHSS